MREQQFENMVLGYMKEFKVREGHEGELPIQGAKDLYRRLWFQNRIEPKLRRMTPLKAAEIALKGDVSICEILRGVDNLQTAHIPPKVLFRKMAAAAIANRMWNILALEEITAFRA